jgi:hypothetical protein
MKQKPSSEPMSVNKSGLGAASGIEIGAAFNNIVLGVV